MSDKAALFDKDVGTWDARIAIAPSPGAEPQESTGVMVNRRVGAWLVSDFENTSTGFVGHGIYGWDAAKQTYVGTWIDPMRSSLVVGVGTWNAETQIMTYRYEQSDGERTLRWRDETRVVDADTQIYKSIFELAPGSDHTVLIAQYRRRR